MKKRFLNLCIMVVGMLALLMYVKEKESTIQDVNAEFHEAKEDDKNENQRSIEWSIEHSEILSEETLNVLDNEKNCLNSDKASKTVWRIDKAVLQSDMYTGTTEDGDFEENLYDPTDYIGMEIEYAPEYFRLGSERYNNPEYILTNRTVKDINDGGKFYDPDIYEFIMDEEIEIFDAEKFDYLAEVPLFQVEVEFDKEVSYGEFDFIPVGTQCVILNEGTMLIGLWGKILLAHRIS